MCRKLFVFVLVLGLAGHASAVLVGYWALDGDATDSSDYGNHGTINGNVAPAMDRFGNPNGAMSFAGGGGDNINVGDPPEFNMTGAMTITAWVYLDSTSGVHGNRNGRILGKMDGGGQRAWSTGIEANVSGVDWPATLQVSSNGSDVISSIDNASLPLDQWVHYAGVYTPGTSMDVYLDGNLVFSRTTGVPASQYSTNGHSVLIGNRPACGNCGWYGSLDEVRFYNEALTEAQIEAVMAIKSGAAQKESHDPQPEHRATGVPVVGATLSWKTGVDLTDPNFPNPASTEHFLWRSDAYDQMNPPPAPDWQDPDVKVFTIGADTNPADGSVDATASYSPTLQMDALYFWAVDESLGASGPTDADNLILGSTWSFETITSGPVADAGSSIVTWLKEGTTTVDLNGTVTDATGDVTAILWSVVASPPDSTVDIADTSVGVTTATLAATGQYALELHAVDAVQHEDSDLMEINVYGDSCEAAKNNPNGYTAPLYDFSDDCEVNFIDFAMFADNWLEGASLTEDALYDPGTIP
jgi:hypothetical protein